MSFFKDFKDDFSEAVDELIPGDTGATAESSRDMFAGRLDTDLDMENELSKLDGLLERASAKVDDNDTTTAKAAPAPQQTERETRSEAASAPSRTPARNVETVERKTDMDTNTNETKENETTQASESTTHRAPTFDSAPASDENAVITSGMKITGDLESTGSIEVEGTIKGNVRCNGKLTVTGLINGNSTSAEFFADSAKVEGEILTSGTVKIGVGSIVIGNISATSAVIAGAVKGDIDVKGPVVVDTSAVVMGNIKSRSVQINNGAVIEGFCSQAYAEVDVESVFA